MVGFSAIRTSCLVWSFAIHSALKQNESQYIESIVGIWSAICCEDDGKIAIALEFAKGGNYTIVTQSKGEVYKSSGIYRVDVDKLVLIEKQRDTKNEKETIRIQSLTKEMLILLVPVKATDLSPDGRMIILREERLKFKRNR